MVAIEAAHVARRGAARPGGRGWRMLRLSGPLSVELHPALSVIAVDSAAVASTVELLQGALHRGGDGIHVELRSDDGENLVAFRPHHARHRIIDIDHGIERPGTVLDALSDPGGHRAADEATNAVVARLCRVDQPALWDAARRVMEARRLSAEPMERIMDLRGSSGSSEMIEPSRRPWRRRRTRPDVLSTALDANGDRGQLLAAAEASWRLLAGPIDVVAALCQHHRVDAACSVASRLEAMATMSPAAQAPEPILADRADIIDAACALVPDSDPQGGPHIVAVPGRVDAELTSLLLDSLATLSRDRQIIVVTADAAVVDWGRLEEHTGRASVSNPAGAQISAGS